MCSKSHWIAFPSYSLIWSDGYSLTVFWRKACEDNWFGCRYIFLQRPIGEITGYKCRLLLSAVPVHYFKKILMLRNVEHWEELTHYTSQPFPYIILAHLHDLEVQEEINEFKRSFHHKWSWHEWQHLRGSNIVPFPLIISSHLNVVTRTKYLYLQCT